MNCKDLDNNCINELPSNLIGNKYVSFENNNSAGHCYSCERLKEQICSSYNNDDFECAINSKGEIYHLKINNQDFSNGIPDIIFEYLLNDKISSISDKIGNITNLKRLDIRENNIETLPDNIGNLNKLKYFNCKLNSIPEEIENLTNLQKLLLANNYLRIIPDEIGNLKNLNVLMLDNNCLESIPNTIDTDKVSVSFEQNTISKYFSCTELKEKVCRTKIYSQVFSNINIFPSIITEITSLEKLDLSYNHLNIFPGIEKLINLQELNLINFKYWIEKLINLQELLLKDNDFESVPSGIEQFNKLKLVDLRNTEIYSLPQEFENSDIEILIGYVPDEEDFELGLEDEE
ncbi:L domain-like protein [Anaeromyces robustus]|uniref:L domain-like protein n=1 Tax=Anaeromyces robustus TaxID=1754192 RepID=A0A1Y1W696_9FUNG|nr:L domain-like protein [Anaeromyces robustus]|eukprot:ORX68905.1 L domain-like protein [Anaeromyces robustus]